MEHSPTKWVLVTGVMGFVGSRIAANLTRHGYHVACLVRDGRDTTSSPGSRCAAWTTLSRLPAFLESKALFAVVHLATDYGRDGRLCEVLESNVQLPLRLLTLCLASNCTMFLSTDTFFGKTGFDYPHMKPYIYSKKDFTHWARLFCDAHPMMRVSNLRLEHVYGEGDDSRKFVPDLITRLQKNQEIIPMTPGDQLRDFVYIEDVANAYATLLAQADRLPFGFIEYEVGTGLATSIKEFSIMASRIIESRSQLSFGALPQRPNEIMMSFASTEPLKSYGWCASTSIGDGLSKTIAGKLN